MAQVFPSGLFFVKAIYNFEGDGPFVLSSLNISFNFSFVATVHYLNTASIFYMITLIGVLQ